MTMLSCLSFATNTHMLKRDRKDGFEYIFRDQHDRFDVKKLLRYKQSNLLN